MVTQEEIKTTIQEEEKKPQAEEKKPPVDEKKLLDYDYELVIIVSPQVADDALGPVVEGISQFITGKGGSIADIQRWGKKKLAYPIKHMLEGNYTLFRFKLAPSANKELETNLKISEKIIRYLLVKK